MDIVAKTLGEMTSDERSDLMDIIAEALEACADDADDAGDSRYVEIPCLSLTRFEGCQET